MNTIFPNLDADFTFERLLKFGLFSERLEDIFSSKSFGDYMIASGIKMYNNCHFDYTPFNLTRNNNSPRVLGIPHPIPYAELCLTLHTHWDKIVKKVGSVSNYNDVSLLRPQVHVGTDRLVSFKSYNQQDDELDKIEKSFGKQVMVYADIANFYPSVYSHTLPWALVGKKTAKKYVGHKRKKRWFNQIDFKTRNTKNNESNGVLIGPDTSNILTEIILSQIDKGLKKYDYYRYIDDFTCYCKDEAEAQQFIIDLSSLLSEFRLALNAKKTRIEKLPRSLNPSWINELKDVIHKFSDYDNLPKKDFKYAKRLLDLSITLLESHPHQSTIKYAISTICRKNFVQRSHFESILKYILNLCFHYPYFISSLPEFLEINRKHIKPDLKSYIALSLEKIIGQHIKYRRSDVLVFSILIAIDQSINLNINRIEKYFVGNNDPVTGLMAFVYSRKMALPLTPYYSLIDKIKDEKLEEIFWLYVYELYRTKTGDPVFSDIKFKDFYSDLHAKNISFLVDKYRI